jgi:hypothetical protein
MSDSKWSLLGGHSAGPHAGMIEIRVRRDAARRAKIAFWATSIPVAAIVAVAGSTVTHPLKAVALGIVTGTVLAFFVSLTVFCWPALRALWHWTAEILILATLLWAYSLLARVAPWWAAVAILAAVLGGLTLLAGTRRLASSLFWCAVSRHRLRHCFAAFITSQRWGSIPLILFARPIPAGERVWIWLRPGLALSDLEARLDRLAAGCWAAECRIAPASHRYAALVRIDLARRNPLDALVESPLPGLVQTTYPATIVAAQRLEASGLDLPDIPEPAPTRPPAKRKAVTATPEPDLADLLTRRREDDIADWI